RAGRLQPGVGGPHRVRDAGAGQGSGRRPRLPQRRLRPRHDGHEGGRRGADHHPGRGGIPPDRGPQRAVRASSSRTGFPVAAIVEWQRRPHKERPGARPMKRLLFLFLPGVGVVVVLALLLYVSAGTWDFPWNWWAHLGIMAGSVIASAFIIDPELTRER